MRAVLVIAGQEIRAGIRNRWVAATTLLLAAFSLSLTLLGSAPTGTVGADPLAVIVVSLASLSIFLIPLIALLLSFDAIVGEAERGTLLLLLAYPLSRWQLVAGKFLGHAAVLSLAITVGYGLAGLALQLSGETSPQAWLGLASLIGRSILLGAAFLALGILTSIVVRERPTAAGLAVGIWLFFVLIYDSALLGLLIADGGRIVSEPLLNLLLLLNPADAYRLLNLAGNEAAATLSGMTLAGSGGQLPQELLLGGLAAWVLLPLGAAVLLLSRRQP